MVLRLKCARSVSKHCAAQDIIAEMRKSATLITMSTQLRDHNASSWKRLAYGKIAQWC